MATLAAATKKLKDLTRQRGDLQRQKDEANRYETALAETDNEIATAQQAIDEAGLAEAERQLRQLRGGRAAELVARYMEAAAILAEVEKESDALCVEIGKIAGPHRRIDKYFGMGDVRVMQQLGNLAEEQAQQAEYFDKQFATRLKNLGH